MASRGASLFAFFFCNEKKKGGFGAPPLIKKNGMPLNANRKQNVILLSVRLYLNPTNSRSPLLPYNVAKAL